MCKISCAETGVRVPAVPRPASPLRQEGRGPGGHHTGWRRRPNLALLLPRPGGNGGVWVLVQRAVIHLHVQGTGDDSAREQELNVRWLVFYSFARDGGLRVPAVSDVEHMARLQRLRLVNLIHRIGKLLASFSGGTNPRLQVITPATGSGVDIDVAHRHKGMAWVRYIMVVKEAMKSSCLGYRHRRRRERGTSGFVGPSC